MFGVAVLLSLLATAYCAPAPKPIVVYPPVASVYHPPVVAHAPLIHPAPYTVPHYGAFYRPHVVPAVQPVYL